VSAFDSPPVLEQTSHQVRLANLLGVDTVSPTPSSRRTPTSSSRSRNRYSERGFNEADDGDYYDDGVHDNADHDYDGDDDNEHRRQRRHHQNVMFGLEDGSQIPQRRVISNADAEDWRHHVTPLRGAASGSFYPVFEWEEDTILPTSDLDRKLVATNQLSYSHGATRIPGKEGILPDTGAVHNLQSVSFVKRQGELAAPYGSAVQWQQLRRPKQVAGVGDAAKPCTHQAVVPGRLKTGARIHYAAPVIGGNSDIPALYGLDSMASENTFMGTRNGLMARVPDGQEDAIIWPAGTRFDQCERAPSGHWLLIISHFDEPAVSQVVPVRHHE
jgi:hypothetical protein